MAFKDGGTVKKIIPPAPKADRPALGPNPVINQNESTYFGTKSGLDTKSIFPSSPMPGPGGKDAIGSPLKYPVQIPATAQQETEQP